MTRYREEMEKARQMLEEVSEIDYNSLRATGAKKKGSVVEQEDNRPIGHHLKADVIESRRAGGEQDHDPDEFEGKDSEEVDKIILNEINKK